ncbi:hypothetical protein LK10_05465 [Sinomonas humi]|uniref:Uncharacterized protein n=1 Tax=Sinomonas humi TaxID=1338436 RepID=A0A0B2ARH3_9MICC|nr:hypothetical protein LK10_05465 [Sinomonas humi]
MPSVTGRHPATAPVRARRPTVGLESTKRVCFLATGPAEAALETQEDQGIGAGQAARNFVNLKAQRPDVPPVPPLNRH